MSTPHPIKVRLIRYLRYAAWSVLSILVALSISYFGFLEYSRYTMRAMNRDKLTAIEFEKLLESELTQPAYVANLNDGVSPVTFHFSMNAGLMGDAVLIVNSSKVLRTIYSGPYQTTFVVQAGSDLLSDGGGDSFQFAIFKKRTHEIFTSAHESTRFWQANKHVYFDLLPFRELNEIGLPVAFKVRIE